MTGFFQDLDSQKEVNTTEHSNKYSVQYGFSLKKLRQTSDRTYVAYCGRVLGTSIRVGETTKNPIYIQTYVELLVAPRQLKDK